MVKKLMAVCIASAITVSCGGCALVSNVHKVEDGSKKHTVVLFGILPIWHTERPVEEKE